MELYVKEMPKSCSECQFEAYCDDNDKLDCPLKPLPKCECEELKAQNFQWQVIAAVQQRTVEELQNKLVAAESIIQQFVEFIDGQNLQDDFGDEVKGYDCKIAFMQVADYEAELKTEESSAKQFVELLNNEIEELKTEKGEGNE